MGDGVEGFDRAFRAAGEIDDDGFVADDGDSTRQQRRGGLFGAAAADFFGQAGNDAVGYIEGGFGSVVARAEAGASGGEENIDLTGVGDGTNLAAEGGRIVGATQGGVDLPAQFTATG